MSPTIYSSTFQTEESTLINISSNRKNSSENQNETRYNNNTSLTSTSNSEPNSEGQFDSLLVKSQPRSNVTRLFNPNERQRQNEVTSNHTDTTIPHFTVTSSAPKLLPSFPVLPNILQNKTHQRSDTTHLQGLIQNVRNGETPKTLNINGVKIIPVEMTKIVSISEADAFNDCGSSSRKKRDHVSLLEPCLYSHRMFLGAAKIFEFLMQEDGGGKDASGTQGKDDGEVVGRGDIPEISFESPQEQMKTFELTFATLKFQKLFRGILDQTGFFTDYPGLMDEYSLVCIILFDFQSRKFQKRKPFPDEQVDELCCEIEEAILFKKTRLQSCVAKERIKNNAPSIEYLIPEQVRNKDETKTKTPVYLWINQMKTTVEDVIAELEAESFTRLESGEDISEQTGRVFQMDSHCSDLMIFPPHLDMYFKDTNWVKTGHLVQQDKSSCLAPQTVQHLLGIDQDLIHVNVGTGVTTAHLSSLLRDKSPHSHIWGFGLDTAEKVKKAAKILEFLGAKNTKILTDNFLSVDPDEAKLRSVRVILVSANCSKSAIASPVQFIVSEGEDMRFLGELSKDDQGLSSVANLMAEHEKVLRHALKFPRVQAVVYVTRSKHEAENELVVTRVLEYVNSSNNRGAPFMVTPPVLPFTSDQIDSGSNGVDDRFIRFLPSDKSNGCFVAIISREPDDPKDVARNVIARAKSGGLLGKSKSATQTSDRVKSEDQGTSSAGSKRCRKLKGPAAKHPVHRSCPTIGVRLYKAGMAQILEQQTKQDLQKPEHLKIVKHPAPFR